MSERQTTCPECGSLNVKAVLTCHDCQHQWDGQVTNPAIEEDRLAGWGI
jgi:ribosomal protein L37AE/L43A